MYARRIGKKLRQKRNGRKKSCCRFQRIACHVLLLVPTEQQQPPSYLRQIVAHLTNRFPVAFFACLFSFLVFPTKRHLRFGKKRIVFLLFSRLSHRSGQKNKRKNKTKECCWPNSRLTCKAKKSSANNSAVISTR